MGNCEASGDRYPTLLYYSASWPNPLKHTADIVEHGNLFDQRFNLLLESQMGGVLFHVIISIIRVFELHNESMCHTILVREVSP